MSSKALSNFTIERFKQHAEEMVKANSSDLTLQHLWLRCFHDTYNPQTVQQILNGSDITGKIAMSRYFFKTNSIYKRVILHYATLLLWSGVLIPILTQPNTQLSRAGRKKYEASLSFLENSNLPSKLSEITTVILRDGCYYGLIIDDKTKLVFLDLPPQFCRSRFVDYHGNNLIDFNVAYFDTYAEEDDAGNKIRERVLKSYPSDVVKHYRNYKKGKANKWMGIAQGRGISFSLLDETPLFLASISSLLLADEAVDLEIEKAKEEIRKIIVQKIPHTNDGTLLFEPDEAEVIHKGTVGMMKNNSNVAILTTYADVDSIVSKTSADRSSDVLETFTQNIYNNMGASRQIFSATGNLATDNSLKNDISLMMILANKFSTFIETVLNKLFYDSKTIFQYRILPISIYNSSDYITDSFKLAQSGYSYLLPALALGISQRQLSGLKNLENHVLDLGEELIPLGSAYTASTAQQPESKDGDTPKPGAEEKKDDEKSDKTIENIESQ